MAYLRDLVILGLILVFWFSLSFILSEINKDTFVNSQNMQNVSYGFTASDMNLTGAATGEVSSTIGWLGMLGRIFVFRIPSNLEVPSEIQFFLGFLNWILLVVFMLIIYRMIRHGGG